MTIKVDFGGIAIDKVVNQKKARQLFANEIVTVSDAYAPFREGYLKNSVVIATDGSLITYGAMGQSNAYARRLWYGDDFNFNGAPIRGARWVERAWIDNKPQIVEAMQGMADRGMFR